MSKRTNLTDPPTLEEDIIYIVSAYTRGEEIESRSLNFPTKSWWKDGNPEWNFRDYEYRLSAQPTTRIYA